MPDHDSRLPKIFQQALEREPGSDRAHFLAQQCGEDTQLRDRLDSLLSAHEQMDDRFLEQTIESNGLPESILPTTGNSHPEHVGPYQILHEIGEGGMGCVYLAQQEQPVRRRVALKLIKSGFDSRQIIARFEAERQALAMMDHPCIARILDAGTTDAGQPYFAMEWVKGIPLTDYCDLRQLGISDRLNIFQQICDAVQHAHQKGIIHRDLKPTNILVAEYEDQAVPKVIDFGLAKALETTNKLTDKTMCTEIGQVIGTVKYMSPEQAGLHGLDIDTRSDIYTLGVILYELLTGYTPLDEGTIRDEAILNVLELVRERDPQRPSSRLTNSEDSQKLTDSRGIDRRRLTQMLTGDLDWIVMKALDKDRNRRYESAAAFADDIRNFRNDEPVLARPPSTTYRLQKFVKKNRTLVVAGAVTAALLLAGIIGTSIGFYNAELARRDAEENEQLAIKKSEEAILQADIAKEVNAFLNEDLLAAAQPSEEQGRGLGVLMRDVLDAAALRIEEASRPGGRFADKPLVEAAIRRTIGDTYETLGLVDESLPHLMRAKDLLTGAAERTDEIEQQLLDAEVSIFFAYLHAGKHEIAEPLIEDCIFRARELLGPDDELTLYAENGLAMLRFEQGNFAEAAKLLEAVARRRVEQYGEDDERSLTLRSNLSAAYLRSGRLEESEALLRDLLPIAKRNHMGLVVSQIQQNLGDVLAQRGEFEEARAMVQEAVDFHNEYSGQEHPDTATLKGYLAVIAMMEENWSAALPVMQEVVAIHEKKSGVAGTRSVSSRINLGMTLTNLGRLDEAAETIRGHLQVSVQALGHDNIWIRRSYQLFSSIATEYEQQNREPEALALRQLQAEHHRALAESDRADATDLYEAAQLFHYVKQDEVRDHRRAAAYIQRAISLEQANQGDRFDAMIQLQKKIEANLEPEKTN